MLDTLMIADDLSGAADCAIACTSAGAETVVLIDPDSNPGEAQAISVDVNSRAMAPQEAGAVAARTVGQLYREDTRILYHKMDSTLRGNWATEIVHIREAAARSLGNKPLAIVAPAFPGAGRTTMGGQAFVHEIPLHETEIWRREGLTGPACVPTQLATAGLKVEVATLEQVAQGATALKELLQERSRVGCEAVVCDARTENDLLIIATAAFMLSRKPLWVGSAGLMKAVVAAEGRRTSITSASVRVSAERPVLVLVGSASGTSHKQFSALAQEQGVISLTIPLALLQQGANSDLVQPYIQAIDEALASGADVAVMIEGGETIELHGGPQLSAALARLVAPRLPQVGGLVVTGGETARAVLVEAGIIGLRMKGEVETGVPLGLSMGSMSIPVITKAGAFGDYNTLIRCRSALLA